MKRDQPDQILSNVSLDTSWKVFYTPFWAIVSEVSILYTDQDRYTVLGIEIGILHNEFGLRISMFEYCDLNW